MLKWAALSALAGLAGCTGNAGPLAEAPDTVGALAILDRSCGRSFADAATTSPPDGDRQTGPSVVVTDDGRHCIVDFPNGDDDTAARAALARFPDLTFSDGAYRASYAAGIGLAYVPGPEGARDDRRSTLSLSRL